MDLVAAVGDVTGDGKGDVLGRMREDGTTRGVRRRRHADTSR